MIREGFHKAWKQGETMKRGQKQIHLYAVLRDVT